MVRGCGTVGLGKLLDGRSGSVLISKLASIGTGFTVAERESGFGGRSFFYRRTGGMFFGCARVATWREHA